MIYIWFFKFTWILFDLHILSHVPHAYVDADPDGNVDADVDANAHADVDADADSDADDDADAE